jgi:RNA polymerase sigma factor (sigma-70 family)
MQLYGTFNDNELFNLIQTGDQAAFGALYRRYWQSMFNNAYKRLKNKDLSQDVVQNIFADIWERKEVVCIENVPAYLHTAVRFQVIRAAVKSPDEVAISDLFEINIASSGRTDDALLGDEIKELLRLWIDALPEKRREIFILHYFRGKSTDEIAESLQISQKTVQNQLHTATTAIKSYFDKILMLEVISSFLEL